jgi:hypothetical protein
MCMHACMSELGRYYGNVVKKLLWYCETDEIENAKNLQTFNVEQR